MDDTETAVTDIIVGDLGEGDFAESLRLEVLAASSMSVARSDIKLIQGTPVVRVTLTGEYGVVRTKAGYRPRRFSRTVTAGLGCFQQLVPPLVGERTRCPDEVVGKLIPVLSERFSRMDSEVRRATKELLEDKGRVKAVRDSMEERRARGMEREKRNLVMQMAGLLHASWTRDMLMLAVNEACVTSVMTT